MFIFSNFTLLNSIPYSINAIYKYLPCMANNNM